jgi:urocanate hydratase
MSGAQPKAALICGCISVTAEINENALNKRFKQGWVSKVVKNLDDCIKEIKEARGKK